MKQKIVIKVQVVCDRCRTKALKIAAAADGVISVALEGPDRDQVVVIGNEVDVPCLTSSLRKKVGHASIVSVEEVKPKPKPEEKKEEDKKDEKKCPCPPPMCKCPPPMCTCPPPMCTCPPPMCTCPPPMCTWPPPPMCTCPPPMCTCPPPMCTWPQPRYQPQLVFYDRDPSNPTCTIM